MPIPFVAVGLGMAASVGTGYLIDRASGSSEYTRGEFAADAAIGAFGGGFVKPIGRGLYQGARQAGRIYTPLRQTAGKVGVRSQAFAQETAGSALWIAHRAFRGNLRPVAKATTFVALGMQIDNYLSRGESSSSSYQQNGGRLGTKPARPSKSVRRSSNGTKGCPSGHYWSYKHRKCVPSKY